MILIRFGEMNAKKAYGLTQWDYGQTLEFCETEIKDNTEIQFYQGLLSHTGYIKDCTARIPDVMLQHAEEIVAYIYARTETEGETIKIVKLPIKERPRPENYVLPEYDSYERLLPVGGEEGQTPVRTKKGVTWTNFADDITMNDDGSLQLLSQGRPIGERLRINTSSGREVELRNDGTAIAWRYTDSNEWTELLLLEDLKVKAPDFEIRDGHLIVAYD
ncbi:hypothetical protein [Frisingicoccus sp.]|uniref:hypothetical protein n=1 Tax=Frisingicoccus sp. TaxID=1918627 RepID=UPI003AB2F4A4